VVDRPTNRFEENLRRGSTLRGLLEASVTLGSVKVREVIRMLEQDGWQLVRTRGSHRQFRHPVKAGTVTVAGKLSLDVPVGTLGSILKQAGLKRD
jgi:predicted RNA binding protein YcfA (HicA-like mRNA interferase family)